MNLLRYSLSHQQSSFYVRNGARIKFLWIKKYHRINGSVLSASVI
jgi:hypothetical protein